MDITSLTDSLSINSLLAIISLLFFTNVVLLFALLTKTSKEITIYAYMQVVLNVLRTLQSSIMSIKTDVEGVDIDSALKEATDKFKTESEIDIPSGINTNHTISTEPFTKYDKFEELFKTLPEETQTNIEELLLRIMKQKK